MVKVLWEDHFFKHFFPWWSVWPVNHVDSLELMLGEMMRWLRDEHLSQFISGAVHMYKLHRLLLTLPAATVSGGSWGWSKCCLPVAAEEFWVRAFPAVVSSCCLVHVTQVSSAFFIGAGSAAQLPACWLPLDQHLKWVLKERLMSQIQCD